MRVKGMPTDDRTEGGMSRPRILYFIRHGEALHNILEKKAVSEAKEAAAAEGLAPDCEETLRRMEEARQGVLNDESLLDAPLSDRGEEEAEGARATVARLIEEKGLPPPTEVLVSPLQRALQTADIVFPEHNNIHVREDVRERLTGKACDTRVPSAQMSSRKRYQRFSMDRQLMESALKMKIASEIESDDKTAEIRVENKYELRERTRKLFDLIAESDHEVLAVVTHKGFLRELERGPFGNTDATEFSNCEVRVYRASFFDKVPDVEKAQRIA